MAVRWSEGMSGHDRSFKSRDSMRTPTYEEPIDTTQLLVDEKSMLSKPVGTAPTRVSHQRTPLISPDAIVVPTTSRHERSGVEPSLDGYAIAERVGIHLKTSKFNRQELISERSGR